MQYTITFLKNLKPVPDPAFRFRLSEQALTKSALVCLEQNYSLNSNSTTDAV
jgi:hypothetical protein